MKRFLIAAAILTTVAISAPASAGVGGKGTKEGPYGPVSFQDYGTCQNLWTDMTQKTTYIVPKPSKDGSYAVQFTLSGPLTSIAGQSPGACNSGTDNGSTVKGGIKGKVVQHFYIVVSGGKFNPKATCSDACATDYEWTGLDTFVGTFFKGGATWAFSTTKLAHEVVTSTDKRLCAKKWVVDYDPSTGMLSKVTGDIATTCH